MRNRIFDLHLPSGIHRCTISYCTFPGPPQKSARTFNDFRLLYLLQGKGHYSDATHKDADLGPGSFLLRIPHHPHTIERFADEPWIEYALVLPEALYLQLRDLGMIPEHPLLYDWPVTEGIRNRLAALFDQVDHVTPGKSVSLLHEIHTLFLTATQSPENGRPNQPMPESIQRAMAILGDDLSAAPSMPEVAKQVGMGYHAFRKAFVVYTGISPKDYRIRRVIEKAQGLLMEPDLGLKDIAYELGYPDPHTFSKQFKRVTGQSPSAFREV